MARCLLPWARPLQQQVQTQVQRMAQQQQLMALQMQQHRMDHPPWMQSSHQPLLLQQLLWWKQRPELVHTSAAVPPAA